MKLIDEQVELLKNIFIFQRKKENLWLNFMDLTGNFKIDLDESREILKDVNEIERKRMLA